MAEYSRRQLAKYAAQQLADGRTSGLGASLAAALIATGRSKQANLLIDDIKRELEEAGLLAEVEVTSAHPVTSATLSAIAKDIKRLIGAAQVNTSASVDESLLGGVKIQTANHVWDLSIRRRLQTLKESL